MEVIPTSDEQIQDIRNNDEDTCTSEIFTILEVNCEEENFAKCERIKALLDAKAQ